MTIGIRSGVLACVLALAIAAGSAFAQGKPVVNLNTATAAQLQDLPGIGARTAERIIEYREKNGSTDSFTTHQCAMVDDASLPHCSRRQTACCLRRSTFLMTLTIPHAATHVSNEVLRNARARIEISA